VKVIKTFRTQKKHRVVLTPAGNPKKEKTIKEEVLEESTNYYARTWNWVQSLPPLSTNRDAAVGRSTPRPSKPSPLRLALNGPPRIGPVPW
jgi:hypothetical protein